MLTLDGVEHALGTGHAVFIPGGTEHGIRNDGTDVLSFFYVFDVDAFDDVEYRYPVTDH